jgi:photosystem II stability/assembly factor-like uncharacterized protein
LPQLSRRQQTLAAAALSLLILATLFIGVRAGLSSGERSGPRWQTTGLQGSTVHFLALSRRRPGLMYAATETGVFRRDAQGRWSRVLATGTVWSVDLLPDDRTVVAGNEAGNVYVSRDGGKTWRQSLVNSQGVYVVTAVPGAVGLLLAGAGGGLYLSRDWGAHWTRRLTLKGSGGTAFAWLPGSDRVVFAGVVAGQPGGSTQVYVSPDGGRTWRVFGRGLQSGAGIMSLAATRSGRVMAGTMGHAAWTATLRSGAWRQLANGMPVDNDHVAGITRIGERPATIYASTLSQGVFRTTDLGRHWVSVSTGLPGGSSPQPVLSLAYSSLTHTLYAGTTDGVYVLAHP